MQHGTNPYHPEAFWLRDTIIMVREAGLARVANGVKGASLSLKVRRENGLNTTNMSTTTINTTLYAMVMNMTITTMMNVIKQFILLIRPSHLCPPSLQYQLLFMTCHSLPVCLNQQGDHLMQKLICQQYHQAPQQCAPH